MPESTIIYLQNCSNSLRNKIRFSLTKTNKSVYYFDMYLAIPFSIMKFSADPARYCL